MKKIRAGTRNSHSVMPFRRAGMGPPATRAPSSTSLSAIACVIHPIQPIQLRRLPSGRDAAALRRRAPERSALLDFRLHGLHHLRHGHLGIGLFALEVTLPNRFAEDELLQPKNVVVDGLRLVQLRA